MPIFSASAIGEGVVSHGQNVNVDSAHGVPAAAALSQPLFTISDWLPITSYCHIAWRWGGNFGVQSASAQQYLLGLGIGDVTGPIVETNMMGYAALSQTDTGLHMRDTAIRRGVLERLEQLYPGLYNEANFALVGTHSHAGVGGTVLAIQRAHDSLALGTLSLGNTTILDTNINRSPFAYEANPAEERAKYKYDQDKELHLLKFKATNGTDRGFLSFFAVHGTSLYENNTLVSTDNKGMADLYEAYAQPNVLPGKNTFIAGFVQANVGDTSPNTYVIFVPNKASKPGQPWDGQLANTRGLPAVTGLRIVMDGFRVSDFESNLIIGTNQFNGAKTLMGSTLPGVSGAVRSLHSYVNMSNYSFVLANGTTVATCPPAMGAVTAPPNEAQKACHYPKPILLNTGYANTPYPWQPSIVDIQMFRIGQLVMLIFPGELTTMAGRRLREAVRAKLILNGVIGSNAYVVVAGPANTYAHYVTTREEYSIQRYEGASTIYGPFTLEAYTDLFTKYVPFLADNVAGAPPAGPTPEDLTKKAISLQTGVVFDASPIGKSFGSVLTDVNTSAPYKRGQTVTTVFQGANPRNNLRLEGTFMTIDQLIGSTWTTVRTDSHPSTKFGWLRTNSVLGYSTVTANWTIETTTPAGSYRITYNGNNKPLIGSIGSFTGTSSTFTISA
ncbi:Neutral/alkaline non-lysosomal ceramidase, C-terminal [Rhizoctonia solani]|uniref:Neutral ceramidase n=1 Tax=Rhizoctonia solani TaxID=456999 RepID=A0A8H7M7L8_9AGAM|nr:Neutral/alkaline non-lysosomal ceramidase, C-terminal [Rhizoctonia solani]